MATDLTVAQIIKQQLGGGRFEVMTKAENFTGTDNSLSFRIGSNPKRINGVKITLNANDEYDIEFAKISTPKFDLETGEIKGGYEVKSKAEGIQVGQLHEVFTRHTGLLLSL
jgi:hypothetical protein